MTDLSKLFKQAEIDISQEQQNIFAECMHHYIQESCAHYDPEPHYLADYIVSRLLEN